MSGYLAQVMTLVTRKGDKPATAMRYYPMPTPQAPPKNALRVVALHCSGCRGEHRLLTTTQQDSGHIVAQSDAVAATIAGVIQQVKKGEGT